MNIIIVGSGKVGRALTRQLARENHDVVVIDRDPTIFRSRLELTRLICLYPSHRPTS